jgi:hypothetical protein
MHCEGGDAFSWQSEHKFNQCKGCIIKTTATIPNRIAASCLRGNSRLSRFAICALLLSGWIALVAILGWVCPRFVQTSVIVDDISEDLPVRFQHGKGYYRIKCTLEISRPASSSVTVSSDTRILSVLLDGRFLTNFCESSVIQQRILLPIDLGYGNHELEILGQGGQSGGYIDIRQAHGFSPSRLGILTVGGILWILVGLISRRGITEIAGSLVCITLSVAYFSCTGPWLRQNDVGGHMEYVQYLDSKHRIPDVKYGWETWQPPTYYLLVWAWGKLVSFFRVTHELRVMQSFNLLTYAVLVLFTIYAVRRMIPRSETAIWATLLFCLTPSLFWMSAKISNDLLLVLLGTITTFLLWNYQQNPTLSRAFAIAVTLALTISTKTSGISFLFAAVMHAFFVHFRQTSHYSTCVVRVSVISSIPLMWLAFWLGRNFQQTGDLMYVNSALPSSLAVPNSFFHYFSLNPEIFYLPKKMYSEGVRESLPTSFLLSLTAGDFDLVEQLGYLLPAVTLGFACLLVMALLALAFGSRSNILGNWRAFSLPLWSHSVLMLMYVAQFSYSCNHNARLWAPGFFSVALLGTVAVAALHRQAFKSVVLTVCIAVTILLSFFHFKLISY